MNSPGRVEVEGYSYILLSRNQPRLSRGERGFFLPTGDPLTRRDALDIIPPPATMDRTEAVFTIAPPPLPRISGTAALAQKT